MNNKIKCFLALLISVGLILACGTERNTSSNTNKKEVDKVYNVTYKVSSDKNRGVDVTMTGEGGSTTQYNGYQTPFVKSYNFKKGDFVYVSAQNQSSRGSITVEILVGGVLFKTETCHGEYCIATVSGSIE